MQEQIVAGPDLLRGVDYRARLEGVVGSCDHKAIRGEDVCVIPCLAWNSLKGFIICYEEIPRRYPESVTKCNNQDCWLRESAQGLVSERVHRRSIKDMTACKRRNCGLRRALELDVNGYSVVLKAYKLDGKANGTVHLKLLGMCLRATGSRKPEIIPSNCHGRLLADFRKRELEPGQP
eukprot:scaffold3134_cov414-Prasinococcus_capsulatus_cf.AAC.6